MTTEGLGRRPFIATYIVTNKAYGTLYTGVTANLFARVAQHREGSIPGFTRTYGLSRLVWFERNESIVAAIAREKSVKRYKRDWKINLIERDNRGWRDLYEDFL